MTEITTLTQFLTTANTQFQIYDMGRRVQHIDMPTFQKIENLTSAYPYPIQGHAQFAIVFWNASQQHYIWFLKLPLDERGLLSPAPRTQFIRMIIEALGRDPAQVISEEQQQKLANHPFSFKPIPEKLALFNALVKKRLGQKASPQYQLAYQYLSKQMSVENWQKIGLQGIADVCVRLHEPKHLSMIINSFDYASQEVQVAVCQCLEHLTIDNQLIDTVLKKLITVDNELKPYFLRALASDEISSQMGISHLDELALLDTNALITIAARNWTALKNPQIRSIFLEALSKQEPHLFNQIFADIVAIPSLRTLLLSELRNPHRSATLSAAIGGLFKVTKEL
ncbi:DUF3549 family protein [Shewanella sp. VB17]|uniref:DUF3549 family protein n=1 Tax=Shewanella sp. VB17 TaxID=2739432 RepID=UPI0015651BA6|nr:DUF3549 family protein [Shewanella sp. VB17]NRD73153.1 DUF3549 family protein [Shewanella sp. VB17]